jgi:site-specific DNA-cytosine methylase
MNNPPTYMLIENVVGFETSTTRDILKATLEAAGMDVREFFLSPLDFGVPYSRPRYFCLARLQPFEISQEGAGPARSIPGHHSVTFELSGSSQAETAGHGGPQVRRGVALSSLITGVAGDMHQLQSLCPLRPFRAHITSSVYCVLQRLAASFL